MAAGDIKYFGGIAGGDSCSNMVLLDCDGKVVGRSEGLGTNHWLIGVDECAKRVNEMVVKAKEMVGIPADTPLFSLGLSLSGGEEAEFKQVMKNTMKTRYPNCSKSYDIRTDTFGSIATAAESATEPGSPKSSDHNQHAPNTQPEENNKRKTDESHEHSLPPKKKKAITPHDDVTVVDVESAIGPSKHEEIENLSDASISPLMKIRPTESSNRKVFEIQKLTEEVEQLEAEVSKIKKRLRLLENSFNGNKVNQASSVAAEKEKQPKGESYNGYTISELKSSIRPTDPLAKVVASIFKKLFTTDEIINCSITGKKSIKSGDEGPRPALDQNRFNVFMDIILSSCTEATRKEIVEKVQNVMKTTRKKHKKGAESF